MDETNTTISNTGTIATSDGGALENEVKQVGAEIAADTEKAGETIETVLKDADEDIVDEAKSKEQLFKKYLNDVPSHKLLADIEDAAKYLANMIEAIPAGVAHGWHSLAAEIKSRV